MPSIRSTPLACCLLVLLAAPLALFAETPAEGANAILALLEEKDYDTLFRSRYNEWYKVEKEGVDPEVALATMTKRFEAQRELLLDAYRQLAKAEFTIATNEHPQPGETGRMAEASIKLGDKTLPFRLYETEKGTWGFHQ